MTDAPRVVATQTRLVAAIRTADAANGWGVVEIGQQAEPSDGHLAWGIVCFKRSDWPFAGRAYGTAEWVELEDGSIRFGSGHYDLSAADAAADYQQRRSA